MKSNILVSVLLTLGVKCTKNFTFDYFDNHPHKHTLYGLSQMLHEYGVDSNALEITDENFDITKIPCPFVTCLHEHFTLVQNIKDDQVLINQNGIISIINLKNFMSSWNKIVLLPMITPNSLEPGYRDNWINEKFTHFRNYILLTFLIMAILSLLVKPLVTENGLILCLPLIINVIGVILCVLMFTSQLKIYAQYAKRVCFAFKKSNCNSVLESPAAKIFNLFSWSEVGFSYFVSNIIIITYFSSLYNYVMVFNILTLPYAFWSIWYQKVVAKNWCPLCLLTMVVLWGSFLIHLLFFNIQFQAWVLKDLLVVFVIYGVCLLSTNLLYHFLMKVKLYKKSLYNLRMLKGRESVFSILLGEQAKHQIEEFQGYLYFGNRKAKLNLTIVMNPHCDPCAREYLNLETLLKRNRNVDVRILFTSYNDEFRDSSKRLISCYLRESKETTLNIFHEWFVLGRFNQKEFFKKYPYDIEVPDVKAIADAQEQWIQKEKLIQTPTILINGYELPIYFYDIKDLNYFIN